MKTSLLILCASLAMAASAALQESKALDTSTPFFILVRCNKPVKLNIAIVEYTEEEVRSAFIEDNSSCTLDRFDGPGLHVRDENRNAVSILHTASPTCKWFGVFVPDYQSGDSPIVECILAE